MKDRRNKEMCFTDKEKPINQLISYYSPVQIPSTRGYFCKLRLSVNSEAKPRAIQANGGSKPNLSRLTCVSIKLEQLGIKNRKFAITNHERVKCSIPSYSKQKTSADVDLEGPVSSSDQVSKSHLAKISFLKHKGKQ